jgi:cytochrome c peroxidase
MAMIRKILGVSLTASLMLFWILAGCKPKPEVYQWNLPDNFPVPNVPVDNPMSKAKVALGRKLFYDVNLSANKAQSCATCHNQQFAFAEPLKVSIGSTGEAHRRNAQSLVNVAYNRTLTWAHSELRHIEQQVMLPMFSEQPIELGITGNEQQVLSRLQTAEYQQLFDQAFGREDANFDHIVKALSSFVRSLVSLQAPFDRYAYQNDDEALSESAKRGLNLFFSERLECHHCHGGFNFTQSSVHQNQLLDLNPFHNTGLYNTDGKGAYSDMDKGLIEITLEAKDMGRFRAPTLRNVAVSAPYMHDGSLNSLNEVVDFYVDGGRGRGIDSPLKSPFVKGFEATEQDKLDLINFLHSLTDDTFLTNPDFAAPESE